MSLENKEGVQITNDVFFSVRSGTIYEYTGKNSGKELRPIKLKDYIEIAPWGADNKKPLEHIKLIYENPDKPTLIKNKVNLAIGKGMILYNEEVNDEGEEVIKFVNDKAIYQRYKDLKYFKISREIGDDLEKFANSFVEIILTNDKSKIALFNSLDATTCRLGMKKKNKTQYLYIADWKKRKPDIQRRIPLFDEKNPKKYRRFFLHVKENQSGMPYYSLVDWEGTKAWTEVANLIPKFHRSGLTNGYNIRYHIKIPNNYFKQFGDEEQQKKKKTEVQKQVDDFLSGPDNAQKTFFSFVDTIGGNPIEWSIETIGGELNDEAYLKLDEHASKAAARGHNIHPVLAGIYTTGNLGSGSEILNLANFHIKYKTNDLRDLIFEPLEVARQIEGWNKELKFGVRDVEFTTTDRNPTGQQNAVS